MYQALKEGVVIFEGSYQDCMKMVGSWNEEEGWHIPSWEDAGIIEKH